MSSAEVLNKAIVRRELEEVFTQGNLDAAEEIYAPNYISHETATAVRPASEDIHGVEAGRQIAAARREAFPDLTYTIEDQVAEGDKVATRFRARGTHLGELAGHAPTGKEVEVRGINMCRIEGGKIAEHWPHADILGMMRQLGFFPDQEQGVGA
jgi:predicted ester cyclase